MTSVWGQRPTKENEEFYRTWEQAKEEIFGKADRSVSIVGAAFLDDILGKMIRLFMVENCEDVDQLFTGMNPLSTFSARIRIAYALGLVTKDEYHDLKIIKDVRNRFAHHINCSFANQSVSDKCSNIRQPGWYEDITTIAGQPFDAKSSFSGCVFQLVSAFIARTNEVKARRCTVLPELDYDPTGLRDQLFSVPLLSEEQIKAWEEYEANELLDDDGSDDWEWQ
jgi:DNA-binding MltR family transcriptional regulator